VQSEAYSDRHQQQREAYCDQHRMAQLKYSGFTGRAGRPCGLQEASIMNARDT
jgi:hypothetical protein